MKAHFAAALIGSMSGVAHADPLDVFGLWRTEARDGQVEISDCGDGTPCGRLSWVDPSRTVSDRDTNNPDPKLRDRALVGTPIVWGFTAGRHEWRGGHIYNPADGKVFRSSMKRLENGTVQVKGCLGPLCVTNIWTHLDASVDTLED